MQPGEYLRLPPSLREINVTGGEPFLREDIDEVIKYIKKACMNPRIIISSNGYMPEKIESKMKKIISMYKNVGLRISLDGPKSIHNKIRGVNNAYQRAIESIIRVKKLGLRDIGIAMTVSNLNVGNIYEVFKISRKLGVQFTVSAASSSDIFFGRIDDQIKYFNFKEFENQIKLISKERLSSLNIKEWARAWYENLLKNYIKSAKRPFTCDAGDGFFYMDSQGNIHACHIIQSFIGNIGHYESFKEIWNNENRKKILKITRSCNRCWMVCTFKSQINKNKILIGLSILKKRFTR